MSDKNYPVIWKVTLLFNDSGLILEMSSGSQKLRDFINAFWNAEAVDFVCLRRAGGGGELCADVCKPVWNTMSAVLTGYTCYGKSSREIESLKGDLLQSGICKKPSHEPQHTLDKRITESVHGLL